jgi:hypothetical protein
MPYQGTTINATIPESENSKVLVKIMGGLAISLHPFSEQLLAIFYGDFLTVNGKKVGYKPDPEAPSGYHLASIS